MNNNFFKVKNMKELGKTEVYQAPELELMEILTEGGFGVSGGIDSGGIGGGTGSVLPTAAEDDYGAVENY